MIHNTTLQAATTPHHIHNFISLLQIKLHLAQMVKLKQEQYLEEGNTNSSKRMKKKNSDQQNNNKRRFSDEQIKSMEIIFETQSKLEPRKKLQLARELDLHPRQVAIWFQNKRARYKSKQLEKDYNILRDGYNSLASRFDVLKKEKQALTVQLEKLKKELEIGQGDTEHSFKKQNSCGFSFEDGEEESIKAEYIMGLDRDEPTSLINMVESVDGSLSCSEDWGGLGTDNLFDESGSSYQWWDMLP